MAQTFPLDHLPGHAVTLALIEGVANGADVKKAALDGKIPAALVNPKMVSVCVRRKFTCLSSSVSVEHTFCDPLKR
jgi:hypothetical protein